jgi:hypothetical protein
MQSSSLRAGMITVNSNRVSGSGWSKNGPTAPAIQAADRVVGEPKHRLHGASGVSGLSSFIPSFLHLRTCGPYFFKTSA